MARSLKLNIQISNLANKLRPTNNDIVEEITRLSSIALDELINNFKMDMQYKFYFCGENTSVLPKYYMVNNLDIHELFYALMMKNYIYDPQELVLSSANFVQRASLTEFFVNETDTSDDALINSLNNFIINIQYASGFVNMDIYFGGKFADESTIMASVESFKIDPCLSKLAVYFYEQLSVVLDR